MRRAGPSTAALAILAGCTAGRPSAGAPPTTPRTATAPPVSAFAATSTSTPSTLPPGPPYQVGTMTLPIVDPSRPTVSHGRTVSPTRALTTVVWYPETAGRHPLVVFGPGYGVGPSTYATLLGSWAAHGYVVAAIEFPLSDPAVAGADLDESDIDNQPEDLRYVTDYLVSPASAVGDRVDPGEIAVAGHSDGGEAAVAAAEDPVPAGEPAFRALICMSAQSVPGRDGPYPPILVTQGDDDGINPPANSYQLYASARPPKYLLVLHGGGHLPPLEPGSQWLPGIEAVSEAFLDAYLPGSASPAAIRAAAAGRAAMTLESVSG